MTFGTRGCEAPAVTFALQVQTQLETKIKPTMNQTTLVLGVLSVIGASLLVAEESKTAIAPDRISLFKVPLQCPAAPEIGCGNASKPILLDLQREPTISEAWLNQTGTVLAVVRNTSFGHESPTKTVQAVLENHGLTTVELEGAAREAELKSFLSGNAWYHSTDVDNLTKQESRIIAGRLLLRIRAKVALPDEKGEALEATFADIMARNALMGLTPQSWTAATKEQLSKWASDNLNQDEIEAFQEAIAKGFLPVADDKEEQHARTPDCCSPESTTKS
jgi:hypothetical protein